MPDLDRVRSLLATQRSAVLATQGDRAPYTSLMAFLGADDLASLILATPRQTTKYTNLMARPEVALLVDDRTNSGSDTQAASALTILGRAEEVGGIERGELSRAFALKHADLSGFLALPDTALIRVRVRRYILVERFQEATVFDMETKPQA
jgi:nitroimidazol reductase NimA-like FMN-containing flavoprotein (pyridoxamine 5'-phosphate oxidase superfamily)